MRRLATPDGARLQPLRRTGGGDRPHQGARGLQAEEGAPVPRRVRARPDGPRGPGDVRPARRPRQGGRADHPDPLAPDEEQPDPPRGAGGRQDGDRRGPRAADRRGRGPALPREPEDPRDGPLAHRRRDEVPRSVRGAAEGDPEGAPGEPGPHHLHRRDPLPDRGGLGRGLARRGQHPEARPLARRDRLHRRDDPQGIPQVHREGPVAPPALPGDHGQPAERGGDARDPRRGPRALRAVPQGAVRPRRGADGRLPVEPLHPRPLLPRQGEPSTSRAATSPTASSPTRRSTSSTRRARR